MLGRDELLAQLQAHVLEPATPAKSWGRCLVAAPGSGKSAVFAALVMRLIARDDVLVLGHAAGILARAASLDALLRRFCDQLATALAVRDPSEGVDDPEELYKAFASLLSRVAQTRRVIVLVDALNELESTAHTRHLAWLPTHWPANATMLVTTLVGPEVTAVEARAGFEVET